MNAQLHSDSLTVADDGRSVLRMERRFARPPGEVWAALTEPAALSQWFPFQVDVDPRPEGTIAFSAPVSGTPLSTGTVTDVEEPRLFAFNWGPDHLAWTVDAEGEGSLLTLRHTFDDRAGAPSFATGWHLCLAALAQVLDGGPVRLEHRSGELHDAYVHRFGLSGGSVTTGPDGGSVHFERQLVGPAETVWDLLSAGIEPVPGLPVPDGFTAPTVPAGHVTEVHPPHALTYEWCDGGSVSWALRAGTGYGARLVLTQTGPEGFDTAAALTAWETRIERLARQLHQV